MIIFDPDEYCGDMNLTVGIKMFRNGTSFCGYSDLKNDLEFYEDGDTLYLYCVGESPYERFTDIEIGEKNNAVNIDGDGVTVDNLCIKFTGAHGIGAVSKNGLTVRNCIFCYIGGSILFGENTNNVVRYGNVIEIFGSCDGFTASGNWIYQIFDTGITFQYNVAGDCTMANILFSDNLIELCHWSLEYYSLLPEGDNGIRSIRNVMLEG